jgi:uncharacterized LabA/DUF88 family protein
VTTQHTQPEQNDADFIAEEVLSASEHDTAQQPQDFTPAAPESQTQANNPGEVEQASPHPDFQSFPPTEHAPSSEENTAEPTVDAQADEAMFSTTTPFASEEAVRPFSDFIEEFRQKEVRFRTALDAYAIETQSNAFVESPQTSQTLQASQTDEMQQTVTAPESSSADSPASTTAPEIEEDTSASSMASDEKLAPRPVSPLLRPASRNRMPRHSNARHRTPAPVEHPVTASQEVETPQPAHAPDLEATAKAVSQEEESTTPSPVEEQPRPPRRYRFDRPAATTASTTKAANPVQPRPENGYSTHAAVTTGTGNGQNGEKEILAAQSVKPANNNAPITEQSTPKQPAAQEPSLSVATPESETPEQDRKRKHGQERQTFNGKEQIQAQEQSAATPVIEPSTPTATEAAASQQVEVSPEDLPPLEYSELQKASSRRRRRRSHPGTATAATPVMPTTATATNATKTTTPDAASTRPPLVQQPSVVSPRSPATPAAPTPAPAGQYSMTSGYTVNQMNHGNGDSTSPFMGPEPSPARGTIAAQKVRSIRTDAQRTPVYPVRSTEPNPASVQQIANVITQSFQIQTDRMIAELRRANQGPTNISVSVPQFPSNERVGVFVDVANLLYSARTLRITIDFAKLLDFLRGNRRLVRAHAYCPTSPQPGDEQMFLQAVKGLGYRITTKNYKTFASGAKKADLDLDLCMDVVRLVDGKAVDDIVLVSGDSDFMPMLDYCSDHGVRVEVAAFDEAMSATLRQSCDVFINLGMLEEIRAVV